MIYDNFNIDFETNENIFLKVTLDIQWFRRMEWPQLENFT